MACLTRGQSLIGMRECNSSRARRQPKGLSPMDPYDYKLNI